MGDADTRLQELWDHHEIRQMLATYCHGCDRADLTEMASVYCEDSWDDHGPDKCDGKAFARLILDKARATTKVVSHLLGQSLIRIDGQKAGAETYFVATLIAETKEGERMTQLGGRYVDAIEREQGHWRIKERLCVRDWSCTGAIDPSYLACAGFIEGQRGRADVSWNRLGLVPGTTG
ncbi:nuclear transport factor 2 family protein [Novosphingobium album (ex Hu et al. 2023)]|uniref:Nuclear transport factor 2 family protein n=1 Tax=Novosphingobium album (ex Hu et al. 2023) TaxID=2930093 RepID=A0ABT0B459_9SPHN|nr:nuclear transport factor 2 family protein [Novosphingobium album (ex Hu et al. 2023)]MCJ2179824.1 nuclear transport factor 2 family protein [Novosphingobium album (ex Hu et al. 2023)]